MYSKGSPLVVMKSANVITVLWNLIRAACLGLPDEYGVVWGGGGGGICRDSHFLSQVTLWTEA